MGWQSFKATAGRERRFPQSSLSDANLLKKPGRDPVALNYLLAGFKVLVALFSSGLISTLFSSISHFSIPVRRTFYAGSQGVCQNTRNQTIPMEINKLY
jgi:hypothetical protein